MASAFGAGEGATMLQEVLRRKFTEAIQQQQLQQQALRDQAALHHYGAMEQEATAQTDMQRKRLEAELQPKPPEPMKPVALAGGARLVDPTTGKVLTDATPAPQAPQRPMSIAPGGTLVDPSTGKPLYTAPAAPKEPKDERLVQVQGPNGTPIWVRESQAVGKPAMQAPRAVTGQERQTLAYFNRMKEALDALEGSGLEDQIAKQGLMAQAQGQLAPNVLQSGPQQQYRQAQRAFTEGRLRKESGAAIPTSEYENDAKTYFFQPGDTAATTKQKRDARRKVLEGLKFSSGRAYQEFYGDEAGSTQKKDPLGIR